MEPKDINTELINPFDEPDRVASIWLNLQARANHSYFTSWAWLENWLHCLPHDLDVRLFVQYQNDSPVCCFFISTRSGFEHRIFYKTRAYLNVTGDPEYDCLTIEYNGPMTVGTVGMRSAAFCDQKLQHIEEFRLPALGESVNFRELYDNSFRVRTRSEPSYFVDLSLLRHGSDDYFQSISSSSRRLIRRSIKQYESHGPLALTEATCTDDALLMLQKLKFLHQKEWTKRGHPGVFESKFFRRFHERLIKKRFRFGEIQLIEITNASAPVGYLYNFLYDQRVLFYQSGFEYRSGNNYRPGVVSHFLAMSHNAGRNFAKYDFLGGESQYKRSLATGQETLTWAVVSRRTIKSYLESVALYLWDRIAAKK